ncbi:MAG: type II toxin-antitoxin system VapC family toxin [Ignavibacteriales bacterium]|nr:type II toxin-antitoxin system VapC family toxin [Ignavibacteriales bacterium]
MKVIRVYIDTSIIGGKYDSEFQRASLKFFEQVKENKFHLVISALVQEEILAAPKHVKEFLDELKPNATIIEVTEEALRLRESYLKANIVSKKSSNDALHVALATVNNCPIIVSWNFKHIVHYEKIALYNSLNIIEGYQQIAIYSPLEVINYE